MSIETFWWIAGLCILLFAAAVTVEFSWLWKKMSTTSTRAVAYVFATDIIGLGIGSIFFFLMLLVLGMLTFGPSGEGPTVNEWVFKVLGLIAFAFPPILIFLLKRAMFYVLALNTISPWFYSFTSTLLLFGLTFSPFVIYIFAGYIFGWRVN